ncbi:hypothetical protein SLEP1_g9168 [Rubroshorea leprosula]|uniref:Secreted peptide n=1 Tax=Rubroshorea leprosula TaxID=152421 RepID=A0AAV5I9R0_9ROSI|nr:hypothetical protein SLEP1_g9168 [Rubroshorea leprosula]
MCCALLLLCSLSFAFHLLFISASFHQHLQLRLLHFATALGAALPSFHFAAICAAFFSFAALGAAFTPQLQQNANNFHT